MSDDDPEIERQSLSDAEIHRAVAVTVHDVLLPALRDDAEWAQSTAIQLVALTRYAARRAADDTEARVEELAAVLTALAGNELVDAVWDGNRSQHAVMHAVGAVLAHAVANVDPAANEARAAIRPVVLRQLDEQLAETAPLVDAFRGKLDG